MIGLKQALKVDKILIPNVYLRLVMYVCIVSALILALVGLANSDAVLVYLALMIFSCDCAIWTTKAGSYIRKNENL